MSRQIHAEVIERYRNPDPCPVCGGDEIEMVDDGAGCRYACRCIECGHRGMSSFARPAAVAFWNREERDDD